MSEHAPGWSWRKGIAGRIDKPWPPDMKPHVSGLCEQVWHGDCPQAPIAAADAGAGQCSCPCHRQQGALW